MEKPQIGDSFIDGNGRIRHIEAITNNSFLVTIAGTGAWFAFADVERSDDVWRIL